MDPRFDRVRFKIICERKPSEGQQREVQRGWKQTGEESTHNSRSDTVKGVQTSVRRRIWGVLGEVKGGL